MEPVEQLSHKLSSLEHKVNKLQNTINQLKLTDTKIETEFRYIKVFLSIVVSALGYIAFKLGLPIMP